MKRAFLVMTIGMTAVTGVGGCGDDTTNAPPATTAPSNTPSASATGATMPATAGESDSGAQATSGLIEVPTTGPSR